MPYEPILIRCDACHARIVLGAGQVIHSPQPSERKNMGDEREVQSGVHEGICPRCDTPFQVWSQPAISSTHTLDLEVNRPEIFVGVAKEKVEQLGIERKEQELRRQQSQKTGEERRRIRDEKQMAKVEAQRLAAEEQRKAKADTNPDDDDGDWHDDDGGGRTPNDDRSDSMNPSSDSYQASMDNHSNQMNPNNDAYGSSRR